MNKSTCHSAHVVKDLWGPGQDKKNKNKNRQKHLPLGPCSKGLVGTGQAKYLPQLAAPSWRVATALREKKSDSEESEKERERESARARERDRASESERESA